MVSVKKIVRDNFIIVIRSMRERAAPVAVSQRPDAGHVGLQLIVNDDVAALVGGNAGLIQAQVTRIGNASHGEQNVAAFHFRRAFIACELDGDATFAVFKRCARA